MAGPIPSDTTSTILREIADVLRRNGVRVTNPYDIENWFERHFDHSNCFAAGISWDPRVEE